MYFYVFFIHNGWFLSLIGLVIYCIFVVSEGFNGITSKEENRYDGWFACIWRLKEGYVHGIIICLWRVVHLRWATTAFSQERQQIKIKSYIISRITKPSTTTLVSRKNSPDH